MNNTVFCMAIALLFACVAYPDAPPIAPYWATEVISYTPVDAHPSYTNPVAALGPATRFLHGDTPVTVFDPPHTPDQIVSLGDGGELILKMGQTITNHDENLHYYGVDLIVFGNSFFAYWMETNSSPYSSPWIELWEERAEIAVSYDLTNWFRARGVYADSLMPTQAVDIHGAPSDFRLPIDPALLTNTWLDGSWSYTNTVRAYDGSAGGAPVDLSHLETEDGSPTNIPYAKYIRLRDVSGPFLSAEIDACVIVEMIPEPSCAFLLVICLGAGYTLRHRHSSRKEI